jgi:hypothetical protein
MPPIDEKKARWLDNTAAEISVMPLKEQLVFINKLFAYLPDNAKDKVLLKAVTEVHREIQWQKIEKWMETRFQKDFKQTPKNIATQAMYYMNISTRMAPLMIKIAQKVKTKLHVRHLRQRNSGSPEQ